MLDEISSGVATADKALRLIDYIVRPFVAPNEEARNLLAAEIRTSVDKKTLTLEEGLALIQNSRTIIREVKNNAEIYLRAREKFAAKSVEPQGYPDEDWYAYFFDKAKNISSKEVQEIWARILSTEMAIVGSVTRKLIDVLALFDLHTATVFTNLCRVSFKAPGKIKDRRAKSLVPFVIAPATLHKIVERFELADLSGIDRKDYIEHAKKTDSTLPFDDYCTILPNLRELILLEEMGLIRITSDLSEEPYYRELRCTNDLDSTEIHSDNMYNCNGDKYGIFCPDGDYHGIGKDGRLNVLHRAGVGYVEYTTVGKQLCEHIVVEPLPTLHELVKYYYERVGFSVRKL